MKVPFMIIFAFLFISFDIFYCKEHNLKIFLIPDQKYLSIGDNITLSCRDQNIKSNKLTLKNDKGIVSFGCRNVINAHAVCGSYGEYSYLNTTFISIDAKINGFYQCSNSQDTTKIKLNVVLRPSINLKLMKINNNFLGVEPKQPPNNPLVSSEYFSQSSNSAQSTNISGSGERVKPLIIPMKHKTSPYILPQFICSASCSNPSVDFRWDIFEIQSQMRDAVNPIESMNGVYYNHTKCTDSTYQSSSVYTLDCGKLPSHHHNKINSLVCSPNNPQFQSSKLNSKLYFICQDFAVNNLTRIAMMKKQSMAVTMGEVVNIVVGCSIAIMMLFLGIFFICRSRTKSDLDRDHDIDHDLDQRLVTSSIPQTTARYSTNLNIQEHLQHLPIGSAGTIAPGTTSPSYEHTQRYSQSSEAYRV